MPFTLGVLPTSDLAELAEKLRSLASALDELEAIGPGGIEADVLVSQWVLAKRTVPVLVGRMTGHPTIKDGNIGATTEIFFIDAAAGLARSFNRWYRLGTAFNDDQSGLQ